MSQKLFQELNLRDNVSRNGFSLDHNCKFTAKIGELLPIFHRTIMPGDKFTCRVSNFTRTAPVQTAAYTRIREYFDWFFVPYRILKKDLPSVLVQNTRNSDVAQSPTSSKQVGQYVPRCSLSYIYGEVGHGLNSQGVLSRLAQEVNHFGLNRGALSAKLLSYLGYGCPGENYIHELVNGTISKFPFNTGSRVVSLLPLAAYQAIYYNWYRNTQWEENQPQNYNFDYQANNDTWYVDTAQYASFWSNPTLFDMQYANYPKDLYFGVLPNSQMGDDAEVTANGSAYMSLPGSSVPVKSGTDSVYVGGTVGTYADPTVPKGNILVNQNGNILDTGQGLSVAIPATSSQQVQFQSAFSILELRRQDAVQKYREILGTGDNNYKSILEKLFNVNVSDKLINIPYYLGGSSSDIKISEVENTNLDADSEPLLKGKGVGSSNGDSITFESNDEYGILMCIYHAQPVIDYKLNNLHFDVTKIKADDYALPVFDSLGMVELPMQHVDISVGLNLSRQTYLGYTIRNYDYKTAVDRSLGGFREGDLSTWYSPVDFDYLKDYMSPVDGQVFFSGINSSFFKVNPKLVDDIFFSQMSSGDFVDSDQLRINANFSISAVRPLSRYGLPYAK